MLTYLYQLVDALVHGRANFLVFALSFVWLVWLSKFILSRRYRPATAPYAVETAVLVPVVNEPVDEFRAVLTRITAARPTEVHVVINGPVNPELEAVCAEFPTVRYEHVSTPGKRNAILVGMRATRSPILVIVDSDTVWNETTLEELVKPFADPRVGGVTTAQRIINPGRSIWTRWMDWMESLRERYSMPAMSAIGTVGCLPGRTIAIRREIVERHADEFLTDRFLGVHLEISDDRTLTNYVLRDGFRSVFQSTSRVLTDMPTTFGKLVRQQYRWAKGSQYNTLRMLPFMVRRAPMLAFWFVADILTPFLFIGILFNWGWIITHPDGINLLPIKVDGVLLTVIEVLVLLVLGVFAGALIRQERHWRDSSRELLMAPVYLLLATTVLLPIRLAGFFRAAHDEHWGTRTGGYEGVENTSPYIALPYLVGLLLLVAVCVAGPLMRGTW